MLIVSIIQALAAFYILCVGLQALNRMTRGTRLGARAAHIALVGGAAAAVASCFAARDVFECMFSVGVALYMATDRRGAKK